MVISIVTRDNEFWAVVTVFVPYTFPHSYNSRFEWDKAQSIWYTVVLSISTHWGSSRYCTSENGNADEWSGQTEARLDTGSETAARDVKHDTDAMDGLGNWSDTLREHRDVPYIRKFRHGYNCKCNRIHQYTSKYNENIKHICWSKMRQGGAQKPSRHAKHVHTCAWYCEWLEKICKDIRIHQKAPNNRNLPCSPGRGTILHTYVGATGTQMCRPWASFETAQKQL